MELQSVLFVSSVDGAIAIKTSIPYVSPPASTIAGSKRRNDGVRPLSLTAHNPPFRYLRFFVRYAVNTLIFSFIHIEKRIQFRKSRRFCLQLLLLLKWS